MLVTHLQSNSLRKLYVFCFCFLVVLPNHHRRCFWLFVIIVNMQRISCTSLCQWGSNTFALLSGRWKQHRHNVSCQVPYGRNLHLSRSLAKSSSFLLLPSIMKIKTSHCIFNSLTNTALSQQMFAAWPHVYTIVNESLVTPSISPPPDRSSQHFQIKMIYLCTQSAVW